MKVWNNKKFMQVMLWEDYENFVNKSALCSFPQCNIYTYVLCFFLVLQNTFSLIIEALHENTGSSTYGEFEIRVQLLELVGDQAYVSCGIVYAQNMGTDKELVFRCRSNFMVSGFLCLINTCLQMVYSQLYAFFKLILIFTLAIIDN